VGMSADLWQIILIFLTSAVKFGLGGVPAAVIAELPFFEAMTVTISGGIAGTFFFTYLSEGVLRLINRMRGSKKPRKKFTRMNRLIVRVKRGFGLIGLAVITPAILSIPLGCFLAVRYYPNKQQIILYMSVSVVVWAAALYYVWGYVYSFIK
jgi:hypothetical protein